MSWADLERKFRANVAGRIAPAAADEAVAGIASLNTAKSLAAISAALLG
jgi:hypothetical protein